MCNSILTTIAGECCEKNLSGLPLKPISIEIILCSILSENQSYTFVEFTNYGRSDMCAFGQTRKHGMIGEIV